MIASSRLFPAVGGSIIAHFLCGIFNKVPINVTEKETKDCPVVNNVLGAAMSVCSSCAIPLDASHAATISGFGGWFVPKSGENNLCYCTILTSLLLRCSRRGILDESRSFQEASLS